VIGPNELRKYVLEKNQRELVSDSFMNLRTSGLLLKESAERRCLLLGFGKPVPGVFEAVFEIVTERKMT